MCDLCLWCGWVALINILRSRTSSVASVITWANLSLRIELGTDTNCEPTGFWLQMFQIVWQLWYDSVFMGWSVDEVLVVFSFEIIPCRSSGFIITFCLKCFWLLPWRSLWWNLCEPRPRGMIPSRSEIFTVRHGRSSYYSVKNQLLHLLTRRFLPWLRMSIPLSWRHGWNPARELRWSRPANSLKVESTC